MCRVVAGAFAAAPLAEQCAVWIEDADVPSQRPGKGSGDLDEPTAGECDTGEALPDRFRACRLGPVLGQHDGEHRADDLVERGVLGDQHHRKVELVRHRQGFVGKLLEVAPGLDGETGQPEARECAHEGAQIFGMLAQRVRRREQQLAALDERLDVGNLHHVHPSDGAAQTALPGDDERAAEHGQSENLTHCDRAHINSFVPSGQSPPGLSSFPDRAIP